MKKALSWLVAVLSQPKQLSVLARLLVVVEMRSAKHLTALVLGMKKRQHLKKQRPRLVPGHAQVIAR